MKIHPSSWIFNLFYVVVLLIFIYFWPFAIYSRLGTEMPLGTDRELFISQMVKDYSKALNISPQPILRIGVVPASAGAFSGDAVIFVSKEMLNENTFLDSEVQYIIGHELGHIKKYDAYRFWIKWDREWAEEREFSADTFAVKLAGCGAMNTTMERHKIEFLIGHKSNIDPHPHPINRLQKACPYFK